MDSSGSSLVWGIGLLGVMGLCGYMALRPWPADPASTATPPGPLSPVVYAAEVLSGKPPAASNPPDRAADVAVIEGGILAVLGLYVTNKIAGTLAKLGQAGMLSSGAKIPAESVTGEKAAGDLKTTATTAGDSALETVISDAEVAVTDVVP